MAVALSLPTIAAILSFVTYSLTNHNLEPAKIFAVLTLYQLVRLPLMMVRLLVFLARALTPISGP